MIKYNVSITSIEGSHLYMAKVQRLDTKQEIQMAGHLHEIMGQVVAILPVDPAHVLTTAEELRKDAQEKQDERQDAKDQSSNRAEDGTDNNHEGDV